MSDENIDVRFIGEQLARVLQELGEIRGEQAAMRQELAAMHAGQNEIAVEVAALGVGVRDIKEAIHIIEHDLSGIKLRVERLERRTGLTPQ